MSEHDESKKNSNPVDQEIGNRLRILRKSRGFNMSQLGKALGLSPQQIHKYETGGNRIPATRLEAIAKVLDADIAAFFSPNMRFNRREWHVVLEALSDEQESALLSVAKVMG